MEIYVARYKTRQRDDRILGVYTDRVQAEIDMIFKEKEFEVDNVWLTIMELNEESP